MLALSSVSARGDLPLDSGQLHELQNQSNAIAPLVAWSRTALTPGAAPRLLDRAFAQFADPCCCWVAARSMLPPRPSNSPDALAQW
ncbi:hypothetical protein [Alsobacter soli]|uniref:hypothetical protein n=1 Tax=Alsobacter soli TaxID=2109933 RepID=UPI0011B25CDE|nr:hypothetical protein [Alsobacter soli]